MNPIILSSEEAPENPAPFAMPAISPVRMDTFMHTDFSPPIHYVSSDNNKVNDLRNKDGSTISKAGKFYFLLICIVLLAMAFAPVVSAATRYSVATGNWNATSTWSATAGGASGASAPVAGDVVNIVGGFNVTVTSSASCASITFSTVTASTLTINSNIALTVSGLLSIARVTSGMNKVAVGSGNLTVGSINFPSANMTVSGHQLTISTGTVTVTGAVSGTNNKPSGSIIFSGAGTLKLGSTMFKATDGSLTTFAGSTVEYSMSGAQTIGNFTYYNLKLSGSGAKTVASSQTITVNEVLSLEGTATIATTGTLTYGSTATLKYNSSTSRTAGAEWKTPFAGTGGVVISNTGIITLNAAKTLTAAPLTVNAGSTLNLSTFGLSGVNALNLQTGGLTAGSSITGTGLLSLAGNINVTNAALGAVGATIATPIALLVAQTITVADEGTTAADLSISGAISGAFLLTKAGAGTLTLSGTNTFTGGTTLSAGTININNAQALGTIAGTFTINSGTTINNTSAAAITTLAYPMTWAGNFTFTGTKDLNLSTGNVTMSSNVQVTSSAGVLTVGGIINAPAMNFTKAGAGSLYLAAAAVTIHNLALSAGTFKTTSGTLAIKGSYSNAGIFTDNLGIIEFSGTSAQAIPAGGFSTQINTLKINNAAGITLNQALIVNNLDLTSGTLNLLSNILTVNTTISNASSSSYVKTTGSGTLRKNISHGVTQAFPVGNSAYNPVSIRNNSGSADFFTVRVLDEVYSNGYSAPTMTASRVIRTWDINKATANAGAGVNFVFNWNSGELIGGFTPTLWHHNGLVWDKQTIPSVNTATSLTYTGYTGSFSPFAILDPMYLLPVIFDGFTIQKEGKTTLLKWNTMQEQNSKDFVIQHSVNSTNWTNIGTVAAAGNSTTMQSYSFIDRNPANGKNLYRIMQRDLDGKLTYTAILYVSFDQEMNSFTVLSNPALNGQLKVNIPTAGVLKLYNSNGQLQKSIKVRAGIQVLDLYDIGPGLYYVEAASQTRTVIFK